MSSEPFISNDLFILYSDVVLIQKYDNPTTVYIYQNAIQKLSRQHIIIFIATELLEYYFPFVQSIMSPFILITTCNDDFCIPYFSFPCDNENIVRRHDYILNNPHLLRWFTKNPSIVHNKISALPLGPKWQYKSHNFFGEDKTQTLQILYRHCLRPREMFSSNKRELLYFHFNKTTETTFFKDHTKIREQVFTICEKHFPLSPPADFENYLIELKKYKFCLSPPGRGIDTHRTWESLMVGTIPIMISTPLDSLYDNLPVLIINDWNIITPDFLNEQYNIILSKPYDFSKLYSSYWKKCVQENNLCVNG